MQKSILILLLILSTSVFAQDRCGTVPFNKLQHPESTEQFENWIEQKIANRKRSRISGIQNNTVYTIPVVIHVIHQGEPIGTGTNIPDEQILSQITTLNEDLRRLNTDASDTPTDFLSVAADIQIEFVLAKRDPEGLPTTGIDRVQGSQDGYSINNLDVLAAESYWDANQYCNIWVSDLSADYLGYAYMPLSNLAGLDIDRNNNALIDGAFIDYQYFGTGYNADNFSRGRTVTHELGHWLGLRHIWGDNSSCTVDDYCDDTPPQSSSTNSNLSCTDVADAFSCGTQDMAQNYMDYTADKCMNIFTVDQKERMRTVIENSPRRKSLLTSPALLEAIQVANDLGIYRIISPGTGSCDEMLNPSITVRNYGNNDISSFSISLLIDQVVVEQIQYSNTLPPLATVDITFNSLFLTEKNTQFTFLIDQVNNTADANPSNDSKTIQTYLPSHEVMPVYENFTQSTTHFTSSWHIPDGSLWSFETAPNLTVDNEAIALRYGESSNDTFGSIDYLLSPLISMVGIAAANLRFNYAYAPTAGIIAEGLEIRISTDCGETFPLDNSLMLSWAPNLGTTAYQSAPFVPTGPGDWTSVDLNLSEYNTEDEIMIAFIGYNGNGNNLYLDDIQIVSSSTHNYDASIYALTNIPIVSCINSFRADVTVRNNGFLPMTSFDLTATVNEEKQSKSVNGISLNPGEFTTVDMAFTDLPIGENQISFEVSNPNNETDENPDNNNWISHFIVDDSQEDIPLKIDFLTTAPYENWQYYSGSDLQFWEIYIDDRDFTNRSLFYNAYSNINTGLQNMFVSPLLDLSEFEQAAIRFDYSYAYRSGKNDRLQVLLSTDCGRNFDQVLYDQNGLGLAVTETNSEWYPSEETDWKTMTINLSDYTGQNDIRLAFAFTNQNGNNLFVDNIEFYDVAEPDTLDLTEKIRIYPNPAYDYFNVKLNFNTKQDATLRLLSLNGEVLLEQRIENTLNQVYLIDNLQLRSGIYILQVLGENDHISSRVMISRQ
ncbi:Por secretion system C-terminal sorting domain-containing protein [Reichenbachiella agariperforans]|uniref:Por secretion system C-terminal sorting domain-containing protein n=1 Tax=Reichenbachiella agariperforans TaxID=156994 RepID=A0A1M6SVM8_REIAG|nr:choice-of-anchor J domain-containing protein [Reichenbachiella agariperforans]SHK48709.1 Por secretion system C-terminal sorting domain-containing protein [Reichenbachiella agariperforans]